MHGSDGLDEVTTTGPTYVVAFAEGQISEFTIQPADIGLDEVGLGALLGGTPTQNAAQLRALLDGATGPYRDIVIFNAPQRHLLAAGMPSRLPRLPTWPQPRSMRAARATRLPPLSALPTPLLTSQITMTERLADG